MKKIIIFLFLLNSFVLGIDLIKEDKKNKDLKEENYYNIGNILTLNKKTNEYKRVLQIKDLLNKYMFDFNLLQNDNSIIILNKLKNNFNNMKLKENVNKNYFGIVQKDTLTYFNRQQIRENNDSIKKQIVPILSMGTKIIHLLKLKDRKIKIEDGKKYNVFCGEMESDSCITAKNIEKLYEVNFNYITINDLKLEKKIKDKFLKDEYFRNKKLFELLNKKNIDIYIKVVEAPYIYFEEKQDFLNIDILELEPNFDMEEIYENTTIEKEYSWLQRKVHLYSVKSTLVTILSNEKYNPIIRNVIRILYNNKTYLIKEIDTNWKNVDFDYMKYSNMLKIAKKEINLNKVKD